MSRPRALGRYLGRGLGMANGEGMNVLTYVLYVDALNNFYLKRNLRGTIRCGPEVLILSVCL